MPLLATSPLPSRLDVSCDWSDKELIKTVPGARWDTGRKMWHVPMTLAALCQLQGTFNGRLSVTDEISEWGTSVMESSDQARSWRSVIEPGVEISGLYPWQVADYYWMASAGSGMLLGNDQGTGKTISVLTALRNLPEALPALVVCPNSVKRVWEQEAAKWFPEAHVYVVGGSAAKRQKTLATALTDPMAVIVINYESLRSHSRLAPYGSIALKRCPACGGPPAVTVIGQTEDLDGQMVDVVEHNAVVKPSQCHAHPKELNDTGVLKTVVLDEAQACFPYDIPVLTDEGWIPIGRVVEWGLGEYVLSASSSSELQWKPIINRWRNKNAELVTITYEGGSLICTVNHRIWTTNGYKEAAYLTSNDSLCLVPDHVSSPESGSNVLLSSLREQPEDGRSRNESKHRTQEHQAEDQDHLRVVPNRVLRAAVLGLSKVLQPFMRHQTRSVSDQPDGLSGGHREDASVVATSARRGTRQQQDERREWDGDNNSTTDACGCFGLADRSHRNYGVDQTSFSGTTTTSLQGGCGIETTDDCDRGGRPVTQREGSQDLRRPQGSSAHFARVVSVAFHERTSANGYQWSDDGDHESLYDLEVAENHNYFADGVLVSNCKDAKSQQTRACWAVCHDPSVTRRIAMTGTPIANHVGDLWSIMHAVAREEYPVRSTWLDRYAQLQWNAFGGMDIVGLRQDNAAEFFSFFDARYRRITKAQAAPWLPEKYRSVRYAPLPTKMRKAYDELDEQLITRLDDGTIVFAPNTLSQTTRLLQVASAYGTTEEDGSYRMVEPSPKLDVMMELLEEMEGRPLVICALSKQLINLAAVRLEKAGVPHGMITGDVHEMDRRRNLDLFQDGKLRALLVTIGAGGVGLTMTAADTILFLQRSWSLIQNLQMEDRVHRLGSEIHEAVHIIDVVAPDTVEEWQIAAVHQKLIRLEEIRRDGLDLSTNIGDDVRHG